VVVTLPRKAARECLETVVSEISERCYAASWMSGIEDEMPALCAAAAEGEPAPYGMGSVSPEEALTITALVEALGGWARAFDDEEPAA
jgi:hypothetical protein